MRGTAGGPGEGHGRCVRRRRMLPLPPPLAVAAWRDTAPAPPPRRQAKEVAKLSERLSVARAEYERGLSKLRAAAGELEALQRRVGGTERSARGEAGARERGDACCASGNWRNPAPTSTPTPAPCSPGC